MARIIGVDSGKYATKVLLYSPTGAHKKFSFRTKMDDTQEDKSQGSKSCVLEYGDRKVLIGDEAETADYDKSKAKDIHKLATYAAIAQSVENGDHVILACGCPLVIFNNVEERKSYKDFMWDKGDINVKINGKEKNFIIDNVVVCPEGSGIIYKNPNRFKKVLVAIVDIGGLNTNCCIYDCLSPVRSTSFTTNLGANVMRNELKQKLNSVFKDANINDWQMEDIIRKGYIKSNKEESAIIIDEFLQKHVAAIMQECTKKGWDIKNIDFIFTGGGALQFEREIKRIIPDAVIGEDADWENVEGFAEVGAAYVNR